MPIPLLFVGDSPHLPTGLGRILRDVSTRVTAESETLGVQVAVAGWDEHFLGAPGLDPPVYGFRNTEDDWGASAVRTVYQRLYGNAGGLLWSFWDPGRCYPYSDIDLPVTRWGYFAIDAHDPGVTIGGPAAEAVKRYDRVLAYGNYGGTVLSNTCGRKIQYLPHGLDLDAFTPTCVGHPELNLGPFYDSNKQILIGCVASNQPRKDLGLFCWTLATLRDRGVNVFGWLHTDRLIWHAWSVPQLVDTFGLQKDLWITTELTDTELAAYYTACWVTLAPGLGEGFGYPLVESMACGTPCVHGTYGGGAELIPQAQWKFPYRAERLESVYALLRPVYHVDDVCNAIEHALEWRTRHPGELHAYCQGAVAHLNWDHLWPRWRAWIARGLRAFPHGD